LLVADEAVAVVVEPAAFHEGGEVGADFLDLEAGDVAGEVGGVGADVAHAAGGAARFGSVRQAACLLVGALEGLEPALRILDDDLADVAEVPLRTSSRACFTMG
jgi:hypothetical protein